MNRESDWSGGYVTDVEYTHGFYRELSPNSLCFATLLAGYRPPDIQRPYTYCELGCGNGFTTNILAAANPDGSFYGIDFNPSHISNAIQLSDAAGLENMVFLEEEFQNLPVREDLPDFDFIVLHGVLSWISLENGLRITDFLRRKLKPGGLVYVSYNALPGWAPSMPLRQLMVMAAEEVQGDTSRKIKAALETARNAMDLDAGFFKANPAAGKRLEDLETQSSNYLAHEYFNRDWHPYYHADVVRKMNSAKLSYIGSADAVRQFPELCQTQAALDRIRNIKTGVMQETVKDYFSNEVFRKDLFMRGRRKLSPQEQLSILKQMGFTLQVPRSEAKLTVKIPLGEVGVIADLYNPVFDALSSGVCMLGDLLANPDLKSFRVPQILQSLAVLIHSGQGAPVLTHPARDKTASINQCIIDRARYENRLQYLASPVLGSGLKINWANQLLLLYQKNKTHLPDMSSVDFAWSIMQSQKQRLLKDGKTLQTKKENQDRLKELWKDFQDNKLKVAQKLNVMTVI